MARANLKELNDVLFEQIERINDDDLHGQELEEQLRKSSQICAIGSVIVKNAATVLRGMQLAQEYGLESKDLPAMITDGRRE